MTETDYILISNLTAVRNARAILRDVRAHLDESNDKIYVDMVRLLDRLEENLRRRVRINIPD